MSCLLDSSTPHSLTYARSGGRLRLFLPVAVAALRVVGVQRRRTPAAPAHHHGEHGRQDQQRGQRGGDQAADDGPAQRGGLLAALAQAQRHRHHAGDHGAAGHQDRPQPAPGAVHGGLGRRRSALAAMRSAKVTSRMALAIATPMAMIAPMNDWMFSVVPVDQQRHAPRPRSPPAPSRRPRQRQPQRLEVGGQQQEDRRPPARARPSARPREHLAASAPPGRAPRPSHAARRRRRRPAMACVDAAGRPGPGPRPRCWRSCSPAAACCSGRTRPASVPSPTSGHVAQQQLAVALVLDRHHADLGRPSSSAAAASRPAPGSRCPLFGSAQ